MRILVTGAAGFVGHHLTTHLQAVGDEVIAACYPPEATPPQNVAQCCLVDIRETEATEELLADRQVDAVIHLAAQAFVPEGEAHPAETMHTNIGGTANLLRAMRLRQPKARLLLVSSAEVYGGGQPADMPFTEESPVRPANFYAISKLLTEQLVAHHARLHGLDVLIARPFTHVGPGQSPRFSLSGFARQLADIAVRGQDPVLRVGNLSACRDITDVRDVVTAYRKALDVLPAKSVFNICSGKPLKIEKLVNKLIEIAGLDVRIDVDPARLRPVDIPILYGSAEKLMRETDWRPKQTIEDTLRDLYQYWCSN